jgi:hypothetical protein
MVLSKLHLSSKLAVVFGALALFAAAALTVINIHVDMLDEADEQVIHQGDPRHR